MTSALSFIGIISLLAGSVVEGALRYSNVISRRWATSLFVVPGLYGVSVKLLKRCNNRLAFILCPGERDSRKKALGLESSNSYKYVGVHSGTRAFVLNALFESWININNKTKLLHVQDSRMIRDREYMGSRSVLGIAECDKKANNKVLISTREPLYFALSTLCQLGAITIIIITGVYGDSAGIIISAVNMGIYFIMTMFVTGDKCYSPPSDASNKVPKGDILITDKSNNNLWLICGKERDIQSIAQKEIEIKAKYPELLETIGYITGALTAVATIFVVPIMSKSSQAFVAGQFGIGLLVNILFSSRDGEMMLKKICEDHYNIHNQVPTRFTNRATAVSAAIFYAKGNARYIYDNIIPYSDVYDTYRIIVSLVVEKMKTSSTALARLSIYLKEYLADDATKIDEIDILKHFIDALPESAQLLSNDVQHIDEWPNRLLMDIVEAFVEVHCLTETTVFV